MIDEVQEIKDLAKALEAGGFQACPPPGRALVIEPLEATMQLVTYYSGYYRQLPDGRRNPVLQVYGRWYEFTHTEAGFVQVPTVTAPVSYRGRIKEARFIPERKRLTPYQMQRVNRRLRGLGNTFLSFA